MPVALHVRLILVPIIAFYPVVRLHAQRHGLIFEVSVIFFVVKHVTGHHLVFDIHVTFRLVKERHFGSARTVQLFVGA